MAISGIGSGSASSALLAAASAAKKSGGGAKPAAAAPAAAQDTAAKASDTYEDADTNQDGVVTALEQVTYDLKHPGEQTGTSIDVRV